MTAESPFFEGEVVAEKYRIVRTLGSGGMGLVFAADHLDLDRRVALKVMVRSEAGNDDAVARFLREARAAARLKSQHVAKVLDTGRLESGVPYIVMELLEGQNLQELVAEQGPMQAAFAVDLLLEACEALAEAHAAGIVHRDLKPANLFLASDAYGERIVKLLDFGISKIRVGGLNPDLKLTDSHSMMGSPIYMSPEQIRSARTVDHRSDIWSLGAVLFELVTGRVVWQSESLGDVFVQIANDPAPSARSVMPTIPVELDAVIARCMDKNPARRYQHVADLALALAPLGNKRARATLERVLRISGQGNEHAVTTAVRSSSTDAAASDVSALPTLLALTDTTEPVHFEASLGATRDALRRIEDQKRANGQGQLHPNDDSRVDLENAVDAPVQSQPPLATGANSGASAELTASQVGIAQRRSHKSVPVILATTIGLIVIAAAALSVARRGGKDAARAGDSSSSGAPSASSSARVNLAAADPLPAPSALAVVTTPSAAAPSAQAQTLVAPRASAKTRPRQPSAKLPAKSVDPVLRGKPAPDSAPVPSPAGASRSADPMSVRR